MTTPPPGWYSDPETVRLIRWWDGERWTAHTHLATSSGPPAAVVRTEAMIQTKAPPTVDDNPRGWLITAAKIGGGLLLMHLTLAACDHVAIGPLTLP
ncbi:uncharacterized protein DUF2510 [Rhodococcus sp. SMB37]|uniref:DUF2510 domain-containing protein n=1 Tax=Rhodococcus sp. SMB37 TaxID=2512213 RepID=UPI0006D0DFDF|nr:DUF2510 domain-containing protein [Rhodococcus sp. SMB37]TCN50192.1 uncharacterized protein DUF2510 [Rhodococcus sp. SMB37]